MPRARRESSRRCGGRTATSGSTVRGCSVSTVPASPLWSWRAGCAGNTGGSSSSSRCHRRRCAASAPGARSCACSHSRSPPPPRRPADEPHDALSLREDGRGGSPCSSWVCAAGIAPTARHHRRKTLADGFEILSEDHREVERLFDTYRHDPEDSIAYDICGRLGVHTRIEEAALYPALRRYVDGGDDLADVAEQEHATAKSIIARIYDSPPGKLFDLVTELRSEVEHHVESEESHLFPRSASRASTPVCSAPRSWCPPHRGGEHRTLSGSAGAPSRGRCRRVGGAGAHFLRVRSARVRRSSAVRRARRGGVVDHASRSAPDPNAESTGGGCRRCGRPWACSRGLPRPPRSTSLTTACSSRSEVGGSSGPSALAADTVATHVRKSLAVMSASAASRR